MSESFKKPPKRYQPRGFDIIHEDHDLIVGNKSAGYLTVSANWNKDETIHAALNQYVRKGNSRSNKCVYVVHRLDQATTGVLVYAKSEQAQNFLKDNWSENEKLYIAVVEGTLKEESGMIESYLVEDETYRVRSTKNPSEGRFSQTQYEVLKETSKFSLVKINLLTGRKNQIRVHFAELGHPVVGDAMYGKEQNRSRPLALHAYSLTLTHPHRKTRMTFKARVPGHFKPLMPFEYEAL